jgi:sugar porter (SP) family MFS transporter
MNDEAAEPLLPEVYATPSTPLLPLLFSDDVIESTAGINGTNNDNRDGVDSIGRGDDTVQDDTRRDDQMEVIALQSQVPFSWMAVIILFAVPAIGGFLFGYDISATSFAIVDQQRTSNFVATHATIQGLIVSASSIGALIGSFLIYYYNISDSIGRRKELRIASVLFFFGAFFQVVAGMIWPHTTNDQSANDDSNFVSLCLLLASRLVYGVGIAAAMHGGPTYLAEMTPPTVRGLFVSLKEASIVFGILMGYIIGYIFSLHNIESGWKFTYGFSLIGSTLMYMISFCIPESSRWLLLKGREEDSFHALRFVYRQEQDAKYVFCQMKQQHNAALQDDATMDETMGDSVVVTLNVNNSDTSIWSKDYRAQLTAGLGLVILQQITGQPSVLSYATPILRDAGLSGSASILLAVFKLFATIVAALTVESFGRKTLLYVGNTCMLLSLIALSTSLSVAGSNNELDNEPSSSVSYQHYRVLVAMFLYIGGYQISFGPISWLMISEIFPLQVRGQAVAFAVQTNFTFNAIVQFFVPVLQTVIGLNILFGIFAVLTAYRYVTAYIAFAGIPIAFNRIVI